MPDPDISWSQLVALMDVGDGADHPLRGVVRAVEPVMAEDDEPADVDLGEHGRYRLVESRLRVFKRGDLARREWSDGRPLGIHGAETLWVWEAGERVPTAFPRRTAAWSWPDSALTERRDLDGWQGDDFTRPAAPPVPTRLLGRPAWQVTLRPPGHKPFPLTLVVDAATGLVLSQRNDGFRSVVEWEELELDVDLPDDLFGWTGQVRSPRDHRAEHEAEMARRRGWLERNGVGPLHLALPVELMLHEQDDDGGFHASLHAGIDGSVVRRRHSDEPWETSMSWPHMYRWTDGGWDWWLGSEAALSDEVLADVKMQLRGRT